MDTKDDGKKAAKNLAMAKQLVKELLTKWGDKYDVTNPEEFVEPHLIEWYMCCKTLSYYLPENNPFKNDLLTAPKDAVELRNPYAFTARLAALKQIDMMLELDDSGTASIA